MKLGDKQKLFSRLLADLIYGIYAMGYSCSMGDGFRDSRVHGDYGQKEGYSATYSLHKLRLAQDINLMDRDGNWIQDSDHPAYKEVGAFWKSRHELCEWGGEPGRNDANHFSLSHDGKW